MQTNQLELKRVKSLLQAEIDNLQAKNAALEDFKTTEQSEFSHAQVKMAKKHAAELESLRDQHAKDLSRLRDQQQEQHRQQLGDLVNKLENWKEENEILQRKMKIAYEEVAEMQRHLAVSNAEKDIAAVAMAHSAEDFDTRVVNLRLENQKRVEELVLHLAGMLHHLVLCVLLLGVCAASRIVSVVDVLNFVSWQIEMLRYAS